MIAAISGVLGFVAGVGAFAVLHRLRPTRANSDGSGELTDEDRQVLTEQFTQHAAAMREQVRLYGDSLAGEDLTLRERLRRFEQDGPR